MFRLTRTAIGCCLFSAAIISPAAADKIADIENEMVKVNEAVQSYSATTRMIQDMAFGDGNSSKMTSAGTYEWMRKDGVIMYRMESDSTSIQVFSGEKTKNVTKATVICDGKFNYTLSDTDGKTMAMKAKASPAQSGDVHYAFSMMREAYNLKVLPDEKVDGHDCYVIEATAKQTEDNSIVKNVHYYAKDLGMMIRSIGYDAGGKVVFETETTDIKKNVKIDPSRFVFQAPPGVEVMELPGM